MRVTHPVVTLERRILISEGERIDAKFLREFSRSRPKSEPVRRGLLEHRRIKRDLNAFSQEPLYNVLFPTTGKSGGIFSLVKEACVSSAMFDFLDHFEINNFYTYRHSLIVFALSIEIANAMYGPQAAIRLSRMGPTHDFGKICVPLSILIKATPLTSEDRSYLEHHALAGYLLLTYYQGSEFAAGARIARDHHERLDRSGYPAHRKRLAPEAAIVAVADIYDALISNRPYRKRPFDKRTALEELTNMVDAGKIPRMIVQALVAMNRSSRPDYRKCGVSRERRGTPPEGNLHGLLARDDNKPPHRSKLNV